MQCKFIACPLGDIQRIRVVCNHADCGTVIEVALDKINARNFDAPHCPACGQAIVQANADSNPVVILACLVKSMRGRGDALGIELVIPDDELPADQ